MDDRIKGLIVKFLANEANLEELQKLESWIESPKNETLFHAYIKSNAVMNMTVGEYDKKKAKVIILRKIRKERAQRIKGKLGVAKYAAAILIGILAISALYLNNNHGSKEGVVTPPVIPPTVIEPGTDKATLILEDGSTVELAMENTYQTENVKGNGKEITYAGRKNTKEIEYNYLAVPRGGQFSLQLADGTKVWLNSETQLKYPVSFVEGLPREVELVYGEAYFEVSPSSRHNGAKFIVASQSQKIEVLGTEFNIKAYRDERNIYSTLVEGAVTLLYGSSQQNLAPGQQSNYDLETDAVTVEHVDVENVVAWKKGLFSFREKSLKEIMKVLSRWYDVDVVFADKRLETLQFRGVISKHQEVEEILAIMKSATIKDYEIKGKTIILR